MSQVWWNKIWVQHGQSDVVEAHREWGDFFHLEIELALRNLHDKQTDSSTVGWSAEYEQYQRHQNGRQQVCRPLLESFPPSDAACSIALPHFLHLQANEKH